MADWREEAAQRFKEKQSKGRFKLAEGETTLRILPRIGSKKSQAPFIEYLVHREVGPNKRFVRCGKDLHGNGDCWLCDTKIPELMESKKESMRTRGATLQPKEQFVIQVATVDQDSGKWSGPFFWAVSTGGARSLAARILGVLKSTKRDYVSPEEGYNLTIERTGTTKTDTQYIGPQADEEASEVPAKILKAAKPFSTFVPAYSEIQMKAAYFGKDAEDMEEEEKAESAEEEPEEQEGEETEEASEEEEESPKKPGKKPKKPADEEEEEETEEQEEEDEAPKKPGKKKKPADEDEEEEAEESSEEEEEEEPAPKKSGKKASKKAAEEEEEETEEEPEEEPEEDEAPPKKKTSKKPALEDEEEEAEESEEEEDEDEPKKKGGKKKPAEVEDEEEEEEPAPKKKRRPSDDD